MLPHGGTLVSGVMQAIRQRIGDRSLAAGARLPSIRRLAESLSVSKSTVVDAYDRLVAEGVIVPRRGSGFYVAGALPPLSLAAVGPRLDRAVDPLWITRQALEADVEALKPGCGWLPPSWLPDTELRRALRLLARGEASTLTEYGVPLGHAALRRHLARRLAERGIETAPDQIILTDSGTQAVDLVCRFLVEPGDCVLVDDPCYFNFHALLRAHRAKLVGIPYTEAGPDLEHFNRALVEHRPRLYLTNATVHNPTGASLRSAVAHRLLKLAEQHQLTIVEDDIFADFETEPVARLAALDGLERVVHVGSFSKTLSASVRCGFVAAHPDWIEPLVDLKLATSFGSHALSAEIVYGALSDGTYRRHVDMLRGRLAGAMAATLRRLKQEGLTPWVEPRGGMFLWACLPEGLDSAQVARRALAEGVVLAPGNTFSLSQTAGRFLRFNVAQCAHPRIFDVLAKAMAAGSTSMPERRPGA